MLNRPAFFVLPILTACQIENKIHSHMPPLAAGTCDFDEPIESEEFKPVAICQSSANTVAPLRESADLYGSESYDPNGFELVDYSWSLVEQPTGSASDLSSSEADRYGFTPDLAGTYTFELVVTNDRCVKSDPCQVQVTAIPLEEFWVELSWQESGDDLDLHLIKDNGIFESEADCYYANCVAGNGFSMLDWGRMGSVDDDPFLDLDDIDGLGPENINILEPSEGSYTVVVHDYPGSDYPDTNIASVKIHLGGELLFEKEVSIFGEDTRTEIATVFWPSMELEEFVP